MTLKIIVIITLKILGCYFHTDLFSESVLRIIEKSGHLIKI